MMSEKVKYQANTLNSNHRFTFRKSTVSFIAYNAVTIKISY